MENNQAKKTGRREYLREYSRQWRKRNPEKERANQARYWERRLQRQKLAANAVEVGGMGVLSGATLD